MSFNNKVVLVTGAASGIGEATALRFAKLSAKLSIIDINTDNLRKVGSKCERLEARVIEIVADVSKEEEIKLAIDRTVDEYERIDVVVNCAGIFGSNDILDTDFLDVHDRIMNVNLKSIVAVTHYAVPALIESKGCVVNIASIAANVVRTNYLSYSVSKAGVVHFTKGVALQLADKGVRLNCILPGPVDTNIMINAGLSVEEYEEFRKDFTKSLPLRRFAEADEIADMVEYLASERAKSITGAEFVLDSGSSLTGLDGFAFD